MSVTRTCYFSHLINNFDYHKRPKISRTHTHTQPVHKIHVFIFRKCECPSSLIWNETLIAAALLISFLLSVVVLGQPKCNTATNECYMNVILFFNWISSNNYFIVWLWTKLSKVMYHFHDFMNILISSI